MLPQVTSIMMLRTPAYFAAVCALIGAHQCPCSWGVWRLGQQADLKESQGALGLLGR